MGDTIIEVVMAKIPSEGLEESLKKSNKDVEMVEVNSPSKVLEESLKKPNKDSGPFRRLGR